LKEVGLDVERGPEGKVRGKQNCCESTVSRTAQSRPSQFLDVTRSTLVADVS